MAVDHAEPVSRTPRRIEVFRLLRIPRRASIIVGSTLLGGIVLMGILVPALSPYDPNAFVAEPYQPPSSAHPFGTDSFGRDVLVRVFAAARLDLAIAAIGVGVPLVVGTVIGTFVAATRWRWLDTVVMRTVDAVMAFPFIVLVLALVLVFGSEESVGPLPAGVSSLFAAVFVVGWAVYARLARSAALTLRQRDHVAAARLLGYSELRIVFRHLLPGVGRTTATYAVSDAILIIGVAAALSFLGAGVSPPTPEWGSMMYEGRAVLATSWWITVLPGVTLCLTGVGISLVADALAAGKDGRA